MEQQKVAQPLLTSPDPGFELHREETLRSGVARVYICQVDEARNCLRGVDIHLGVHEARKRFKKIRTLLRLVRSYLGEGTWKKENMFFGDIARSIGAVRDAQSLLECVQKLKQLDDQQSVKDCVVFKLTRRRDWIASRAATEDVAGVAAKLDEKLKNACEDWGFAAMEFSPVLEKGILTLYSKGHGWFVLLQKRGGNAEEYHEFRKVTKQLWSTLVLLSNMWLAVLVPLCKVWKNLADDLGDHHDLACLKELSETREIFVFQEEDTMREALLDAIDCKRVSLERSILERGALLYALEPKSWVQQLKAMWLYWKLPLK